MTIPVIFCVDVEPDPRLVNHDAPEPWVGYEITQRYLRELRPRIEAATGAPVHYSWFLRIDAQIEPYGSATWAVDRYGAHMEEIQRAGDEIGVHPHAYRWLENERSWLHDFGNQAWVEHCLTMSVEGFAKALGRTCLSLRFGDRWLNTETVNLAERLGIRFDLSVEPGTPGGDRPENGGAARPPDLLALPLFYSSRGASRARARQVKVRALGPRRRTKPHKRGGGASAAQPDVTRVIALAKRRPAGEGPRGARSPPSSRLTSCALPLYRRSMWRVDRFIRTLIRVCRAPNQTALSSSGRAGHLETS